MAYRICDFTSTGWIQYSRPYEESRHKCLHHGWILCLEVSISVSSRMPITNETCSVIGPQFFNKPPHYSKPSTPTSTLHTFFAYTLISELGIGSCIFTFAGMIVTAVLFQIYIMRLNQKRAPIRDQALAVLEGRLETGFEDLTDKENPLFVYVY
jgi:hypothetical protein